MNILYIFDFDDTLIRADTLIHITHADGSQESLSSAAYAKYKELPGDKFDFSDFDAYPPNASIIEEVFAELKAAIALDGVSSIVILTARSNPEPVEQFLSDNGILGIEIKATGSSDPRSKAVYVLERLKNEEIDEVRVFEDNVRNIRTIQKVVEPTGTKFKSIRVTKTGMIEHAKSNKINLLNLFFE